MTGSHGPVASLRKVRHDVRPPMAAVLPPGEPAPAAGQYRGMLERGQGGLGAGRVCVRLRLAEVPVEGRAADAPGPV